MLAWRLSSAATGSGYRRVGVARSDSNLHQILRVDHCGVELVARGLRVHAHCGSPRINSAIIRLIAVATTRFSGLGVQCPPSFTGPRDVRSTRLRPVPGSQAASSEPD